MKAVRRPLAAGMVSLGFALAVSSPAHAAPGITIGPGRQMVSDFDHIMLLVGNTGDVPVAVTMKPRAYENSAWITRDDFGMEFSQTRFTLAPFSQTKVYVDLTTVPDTPCIFAGVGAQIHPTAGAQLNIYAIATAQLLLQGTNGTEADCVALIPGAPQQPPAGTNWLWLFTNPVARWVLPWMVVGVPLLLLFGWKRRKRNNE